MEARLRERQEDRKAALEKRKTDREQTQRVEESADYFEHQFAEKRKGIYFWMNAVFNLFYIQLLRIF